MNKNIFLMFIFVCTWNIATAQELREFKQPGMFSETAIYKDNAGESYSGLVTFRFKSNMVGTSRNRSVVSLYEIQRSEFRDLLGEISKKFGRFDIIKLHPDKLWGDTLRVHRRTGEIVGVIDLSQIYQLKFDRPVPHDSVASLLRRSEEIEYAEGPLVGYTTSVDPNDHWFHQNSPHNPEPYRWSFDALDAPLAWGLTKGSSEIRIGIHDGFSNKINTLHDELVNKVVWIHPTISNSNRYGGHGIQVAGVAGAETNNSDGIASLGWNTSLMLSPMSNQAITQLTDNGADIINFSWITKHPGSVSDNTSLQNVIKYALQNGVILTAGAGNGPQNLALAGLTIPSVVFPAAFNFGSLGRVIAVSATWVENGTEDFITGWNHSPGTDPINNPGSAFIDFSATGANIRGLRDTVYNATQHLWAGTSFSAPKVAAIAALILSVNNTITPNDLFDILHATSEKIGANNYDSNDWNQYMGYGRVNAYQALKYTIENYGGLLGADGETVFITEDFNIASGKSLTIASGTELLLSGNLHINSQADLIVEPGVTIKIDPGKSITIDGTLLAIGTQSDPIRFQAGGSSRWDRVRLTGSSSNSDIRWAVFEGGQNGLSAGGSGHQIRN
ncbi:MAG: S8 family peptidase, partial [Cyclonatronaceae bacterium]